MMLKPGSAKWNLLTGPGSWKAPLQALLAATLILAPQAPGLSLVEATPLVIPEPDLSVCELPIPVPPERQMILDLIKVHRRSARRRLARDAR